MIGFTRTKHNKVYDFLYDTAYIYILQFNSNWLSLFTFKSTLQHLSCLKYLDIEGSKGNMCAILDKPSRSLILRKKYFAVMKIHLPFLYFPVTNGNLPAIISKMLSPKRKQESLIFF